MNNNVIGIMLLINDSNKHINRIDRKLSNNNMLSRIKINNNKDKNKQ